MKPVVNLFFASLFVIPSIVIAAPYTIGSDITDQLNRDIQALPANGTLYIPAGEYKIDATKGINLKSNIKIQLSPKTVLQVIPNDRPKYALFNIQNINNVALSGGTLIGDKYTHKGSKGEWGKGINVLGSQNISIKNMAINKMWGDGIYLGNSDIKGAKVNTNIHVDNVIFDDNRRQGLSLITGNQITLSNITASNTKGTNPSCGIDIEPNQSDDQLNQIVINNLITTNNKGCGLAISIRALNNPKNKVDITVNGHQDKGSFRGLILADNTKSNIGTITLNNLNYADNGQYNICRYEKPNNNIQLSINQPVLQSSYFRKNYFCSHVDSKTISKIKKAVYK